MYIEVKPLSAKNYDKYNLLLVAEGPMWNLKNFILKVHSIENLVVSAGVPSLNPLGFRADLSPGTVFLLQLIFTCLPLIRERYFR